MTWLFENPFWILFLGVTITVGLLIGWLKTTRKEFGIAAGVSVLLTIVMVMLGITIETDREKIRNTVNAMATAVENNDVQALLGFVSTKHSECRKRIEAEMPSYTFERCNVMSFNALAFDAPKNPTKAMVVFFVWADVNAPSYSYDGNVRRRVILFFERNDAGEWLLYDYDHEDPAQASRYLKKDGPTEFVEGPATWKGPF